MGEAKSRDPCRSFCRSKFQVWRKQMRNTTMRDQSKSVKPKQHHSQATSNKIETPSQGFKKLIPRDRTFEVFPKHEPSTTKKWNLKKREVSSSCHATCCRLEYHDSCREKVPVPSSSSSNMLIYRINLD